MSDRAAPEAFCRGCRHGGRTPHALACPEYIAPEPAVMRPESTRDALHTLPAERGVAAETLTARCPGCGHSCCPYPGLECGGDSDRVRECEFERILADRLAAQRADLTARLAAVEKVCSERSYRPIHEGPEVVTVAAVRDALTGGAS